MTGQTGPERVRRRAVLISLLFTVANSYWLMSNWGAAGYNSGQSFPTVVSLYFNVIFFVIVLLAWNALVRPLAPGLTFSGADLMVVHLLLAVASSLAGHDILQIHWPHIAHVIWYATPENEWAELFHQYVPSWLAIKSRQDLASFYYGESSLYAWKHLRLWLAPVFWWSSLLVVLTGMMVALALLVRRQWIHHEKLTYPIIQIPLELTRGTGSGILRDRLFWLGAVLAGAMNLLNGLHFLYPAVPSVGGAGHGAFEMGYDLGRLFTTKPLSAIGYTPLAFYPFAIGMSYFMPIGLAFSVWFFYLFQKGVQVWEVTMGVSAMSTGYGPQAKLFGAWFGIGIFALWTTRRWLAIQIRNSLPSRCESTSETSIGRVAFLGICFGAVFVSVFCMAAGIPPFFILLYFALYLALAFALTRVRAELGPPTHDALWQPGGVLMFFFGSRQLGGPAMTLFGLFRGFNRSYRCHQMPVIMEGLKAADVRRVSPGSLVLPVILVTAVACVSSAWAYYSQGYRFGAEIYGEHWSIGSFNELRSLFVVPRGPEPSQVLSAAGSLLFTGLLAVMNRRFLWWPFHPAGYAIGIGYPTMHWYWFSIFVSWALKLVLLRGGGIRAYRRGVPFFAGLVVGEFFVGALWSLIGLGLDRPMYRFMF